MRIALVAPPFESVPPRLYGGTERVVASLCRGLIERDHEVTLFASGDSTTEARLIATTPQALRLQHPPVTDCAPAQLNTLTEVLRLADEFDVVHNHNDYWTLPLSELSATPLLTTLHGRLDLPGLNETLSAFPRSRFISISDSQRAPIRELAWLRTIPHGLALETFQFQAKPGNYLAFLGRICWEKRPDLAVQIARESGIPLKIAAKIEPGSSQEFYDQAIRPHVDGKFIEYVGEIAEHEKSEFLGHALATVFPIDWPEPFGLVMIESLACGTPVLARPFGSVPEILEDNVTGFIRERASELAELAQNEIPRLSREECRKTAEQRFSLERMTEDYLDVYRTLAPSPRRSNHRRGLLHSLERSPQRSAKTYVQG